MCLYLMYMIYIWALDGDLAIHYRWRFVTIHFNKVPLFITVSATIDLIFPFVFLQVWRRLWLWNIFCIIYKYFSHTLQILPLCHITSISHTYYKYCPSNRAVDSPQISQYLTEQCSVWSSDLTMGNQELWPKGSW